MSYINVYPARIEWENEPSINTPINALNLNRMDYALYSIDQTLANWDTSKANQSDLLLSVKSIDYDTSTGVFVFTWQNGTTKTVDLNIEKIPVSFSMDANGVITMTTEDGTTYTADVGALIKTYTFTDSTVIDFTVTTDASGNKTVTADIVDGSITGQKLQPNYLADCQTAATNSSNSATAAASSKGDSEAWAVGTRGGVPVPSTDPAYQNNSYWWSQHGASNSLAGLTDTDITNPTSGQTIIYDTTDAKWKNGSAVGGGSTIVVTTTETTLYGQNVTITDGTTTLTETFDNTGVATFKGVTMTGNLTIASGTTSTSLNIPYFGNYTAVLSSFSASITVTYPNTASCTCTGNGESYTASGSPYTFTVHGVATYTITTTLDGVTKTDTVIITTDGQTESVTVEYGTINLTYADDFRGQTVNCVNGGTTITKTAPSSGNTMVFYPPTTGTWVISSTVSGSTYTVNAVITSLSTPASVTLNAIPNGSTVTPTDDIQIWLACAGITDKAYTTLAEVLADTDTYTTLLGDSNACDYMARSTTWSTDIVADADAMRLLGMYDYACDALLSDSTWASAIAGSTYFESVLNVKVPKATSDNANILKSGVYNNYYAYYAFDENNSTMFGSQYNSDPKYVGYNFTTPVRINKCKLLLQSDGTSTYVTKIKVQGSNDGTNWTDVETKDVSTTTTSIEFGFINDNAYSRYRAVKGAPLGDGHSIFIYTLQFYGRRSAQTDIIHSAPSDTIYYMDNGSPVTLCTTDTDGIGSVDWSDLPTGDITLYSSVAKNPDDLTADYSKTIKVTKNKVEGYLMPDKALYWYGYKDALLQDVSTANGWSRSGSWTGMTAPTYQTNYVSLKGSSSTTYSGIGSATSISLSGLNLVINPIALSSASRNGLVSVETTKTLPSGTYPTDSNHAWATTTGIQKLALSPTENNYYPACISATNSQCDLYAMWYE